MRLFVLFVTLALGFVASASACKCASQDFEAPYVDAVSQVFVGRVVSGRVLDGNDKGDEAEISVSEVIKGRTGAVVTLWSGPTKNSCSTRFTIGAEYIFFIQDDGVVWRCSGTRRYNRFLDQRVLERIKSHVR